ncbi:MAG: CHAD domain-containing protein [Porphyrobacter sp.]|nr:CHAD domain-containing protein [Porphyrobacter sp.]
MAFRFKARDGSVEASLRRIGAEQLDKALAAIAGPENAAVHAVRERCKKLRALIRLVRPAFPAYAEENAFLRDTARLVSHKRDAFVIRETFEALTGEPASVPTEPEQKTGPLLEQCRQRLLDVRVRTQSWSLEERGWAGLAGGFTETVRRARRAAKHAREDSDPHAHHDLRKQVKYHGFHCQLLRPVRPGMLKHRTKQASGLADDLGRHHDLALLTSHLTGSPTDFITARRSHEVLLAAAKSSDELEQRADRQAKKLFKKRPAVMTKRLGKRWKRWAENEGFAG